MKHRPWQKNAYQGTSLLAGVLLLLFIFVSAGYFYFLQGDDSATAAADDAYMEAQAQWDEMRPVAFRYEVIYSASPDGTASSAYKVTEEGTRQSAVYKPSGEVLSSSTKVPAENVMTVDRLLAKIASTDHRSAMVDASYDPRFGFPARAGFETDDGHWERYVIRDFEVLNYQ